MALLLTMRQHHDIPPNTCLQYKLSLKSNFNLIQFDFPTSLQCLLFQIVSFKLDSGFTFPLHPTPSTICLLFQASFFLFPNYLSQLDFFLSPDFQDLRFNFSTFLHSLFPISCIPEKDLFLDFMFSSPHSLSPHIWLLSLLSTPIALSAPKMSNNNFQQINSHMLGNIAELTVLLMKTMLP